MLLWIPAHCNITGNERADSLAKTAAFEGEPSNTALDFSNFLSIHRSGCVTDWQARWRNGELGRFCFSILNNVSLSTWFQKFGELNRYSVTILSRIIANHTRLKDHLNRINIEDSSLCLVCETYKSCDHVVWFCSKYDRYRPELLQSLRNAGVGPQVNNVRDTIAVALNSGSSDPLSALTKFVHRCTSVVKLMIVQISVVPDRGQIVVGASQGSPSM